MVSNMGSNPRRKKVNKPILKLSPEEARKCKFVMVDQNLRLAECVVHKEKGVSHGLRLFPIHEWVVENGVPYRLVDNKKVAWYHIQYGRR